MAIIYIPGTYLHVNTDEHVIMLIKVRLADLMTMIYQNLYRKFVIIKRKGESTMYVKIQKALYGLLRRALFFCKMLVKDLEVGGFIFNPYDPCVDNKMVNVHQMKVTWHLYDLKMFHKDPFGITMFAAYLESIYGEKLEV